jgi:hypothetical protein
VKRLKSSKALLCLHAVPVPGTTGSTTDHRDTWSLLHIYNPEVILCNTQHTHSQLPVQNR